MYFSTILFSFVLNFSIHLFLARAFCRFSLQPDSFPVRVVDQKDKQVVYALSASESKDSDFAWLSSAFITPSCVLSGSDMLCLCLCKALLRMVPRTAGDCRDPHYVRMHTKRYIGQTCLLHDSITVNMRFFRIAARWFFAKMVFLHHHIEKLGQKNGCQVCTNRLNLPFTYRQCDMAALTWMPNFVMFAVMTVCNLQDRSRVSFMGSLERQIASESLKILIFHVSYCLIAEESSSAKSEASDASFFVHFGPSPSEGPVTLAFSSCISFVRMKLYKSLHRTA